MSLIPPCPVSLEELIEAVCKSGRLHHLSLCRIPNEDRYQASFKRSDGPGYKVHIAETAAEALERVLGPDYGHDWSEVLGAATEAGWAEALDFAIGRTRRAEVIEEDDDFNEDDLI